MAIYDKLKEYLPEYHTRQMRKDFISSYCNMNAQQVPKHVLRAIYTDLTVDASALQNVSVDLRVQQAITANDPDLVIDLRHLNAGRPDDTFSIFFEHLNKKVEDLTAVDDRRHGVCHFSEYISVKDLISQVSKDLPPMTPVPSESTVLYAFMPKNANRKTAKLYTSKVGLQFKVQSRQLRASHPDEHYCAAVFRYLKDFAIENKDFVNFLCVDFGEPGQAVQTGVRGKKSIVPTTSTLAALDHDQQSKGSLTPSVCLNVDIPSERNGSFYRGSVVVCYKDSVFESSTPFRHATELEKIIVKSDVKPVLIIFSDGGPDHRLTYHSVKLALIGLFKRLGVDTLIAARTAPGHSWVNPAERMMSILNLAIQNCALSRAESDSTSEMLLRSCHSMADIRSKAAKTTSLKPAWLAAVKPIKRILESRTSRLSLKGVSFCVEEPAEADEVQEFELHTKDLVDPNIVCGKYQQVHMKSKEAYQKYLSDHCKQRHYMFQIKKCDNIDCCGPKMHTSKFPRLPDPVPKEEDSSHYKSYSEVVNTDTVELRPPSNVDRPKAVAEKLQGIRNDGLVGQNVRKIVSCYECQKPRCVYSKNALSVRDDRALRCVLDKHDYCCGAQIVPEGDALEGVVSVRLQMSCESHVEFSYYASSVGRHDVCAHCACTGAERDPDVLKQYRVVLPVCGECKRAHKIVPRRNPIKL